MAVGTSDPTYKITQNVTQPKVRSVRTSKHAPRPKGPASERKLLKPHVPVWNWEIHIKLLQSNTSVLILFSYKPHTNKIITFHIFQVEGYRLILYISKITLVFYSFNIILLRTLQIWLGYPCRLDIWESLRCMAPMVFRSHEKTE